MPLAPVTVYAAARGLVAQRGEDFFLLPGLKFDALFQHEQPAALLYDALAGGEPIAAGDDWRAPIGMQEVWAAGVTYLRSREARKEESKEAGGGDFYHRVYEADRPEIFFKATPHRVVGSGGAVRIRSDSHWNVPEPEVALAINRAGAIFGYTIGNDMSSRDIEGENPLYLPQAKVYSACCGLGPGLVVRDPLPSSTRIRIAISRGGTEVFAGATALDQMKRGFDELVAYLYRDNDFPNGAYLLTGTGVVPGQGFTLASGDEIWIDVDGLGTLVNRVA